MLTEVKTVKFFSVILVLLTIMSSCKTEPKTEKPILVLHDLRIADVSINGIRFSSTADELKERLGSPRELVTSPGDSALLDYGPVKIGTKGGTITLIGGEQLSLAGKLVKDDIDFIDFAGLYGVPESVSRTVSVGTPDCVLSLKDGFLHLALARKKIIGYQVYKR